MGLRPRKIILISREILGGFKIFTWLTYALAVVLLLLTFAPGCLANTD